MKQKLQKVVSSARSRWQALVFGMVALLAAPAAFATGGGGSLASQVLTQLAGVEADVTSILALMIGVLTLFVLYTLIRRAMGK